jgi:hypothetical protein
MAKLLQRLERLTDEQERRIQILMDPGMVGRLLSRCAYEVLVYHTQFEFETTNEESEARKKIRAKFRAYDEAEEYAQWLVMKNASYFRVILRA